MIQHGDYRLYTNCGLINDLMERPLQSKGIVNVLILYSPFAVYLISRLDDGL